MEAPVAGTTPDHLVDHVIPSRARIPADPAPGDYIVIDVTNFSTTVTELLANGAAYVHITEERGDELAFKRREPEARIGGEHGPDYALIEEYDFFNSPSSVQTVDVDGRPTAMTSTDGGTAVTDLRQTDAADIDVYVGGLCNAAALAAHLREHDRPTFYVAAGDNGTASPEDIVGSVVLDRYVRDDPPSRTERDAFRRVIKATKAPTYADKAAIRERDLYEYALAINSRTVVPKLRGQKLYDVSD